MTTSDRNRVVTTAAAPPIVSTPRGFCNLGTLAKALAWRLHMSPETRIRILQVFIAVDLVLVAALFVWLWQVTL